MTVNVVKYLLLALSYSLDKGLGVLIRKLHVYVRIFYL